MELWLETVLLLAAAVALHSTRLSWPLRWAETFYHEASHGLVTLLTGGRVVKLELHWRGGGACTTQGGSRFLTLLAGYMGASLWGAVLFLIGANLGEAGVRWWLGAELALLGFALLFWAKNVVTMIILLLIGAVYAAAWYLPPEFGLAYVLQGLGLFIMLNALGAPFHLLDGQHVGDGAALQDLTVIVPEGVWVAWWVVFALACLLGCLAWRLNLLPLLAGAF
ncbi:MAG: M50 family metallopeptidase [Alphaproteobacteria bacterium]|nr:M50 family metallopeptidase [Alphaproteobacteria bacterium]